MLLCAVLYVASSSAFQAAGQPGPEAQSGALLTPPPCSGSWLVLTPNTPPTSFLTDTFVIERGVFVTAIKPLQICSLGIKLQVSGTLPKTLTAHIYHATGTTRGSLLATGSISLSDPTNSVRYVPITATLMPCADYELVFVVPASSSWESWLEGTITEPFDVGGAIRARDGSANGDATNAALLHFEVIGTPPSSAAKSSDLGGPVAAPNTSTNANQERGVYVHMLDTAQLCTFGFEADLVSGTTLTARVYSATGTTRGAQLASGTYTVPSSGLQWHDVPVSFQLLEGNDYDIAVTYAGVNSWPWWDESTLTEPYTVNVFQLVTAEAAGDGSTNKLLHFRAGWDEKTGGTAFDLAKPTGQNPPPFTSSSAPFSDYGIYVTASTNERLYGVGWKADIPAGQTISATVFNASGIFRLDPIAQGSVVSSSSGMRWHDIPLAGQLQSGADYDIAIQISAVNEFRYWSETNGLPYTSYGVLQIRDGEEDGYAGVNALIQLRVYMCNSALTPVADEPLHTPMFMSAPAPNPVSGTARLDFSLEAEEPISIRVYDTSGRLVATVLDGTRSRGWHRVDIDSKSMASGVYFLKMQTPGGSLSRKFVVAH
jgi:hypothetical protein